MPALIPDRYYTNRISCVNRYKKRNYRSSDDSITRSNIFLRETFRALSSSRSSFVTVLVPSSRSARTFYVPVVLRSPLANATIPLQTPIVHQRRRASHEGTLHPIVPINITRDSITRMQNTTLATNNANLSRQFIIPLPTQACTPATVTIFRRFYAEPRTSYPILFLREFIAYVPRKQGRNGRGNVFGRFR